jgi:hypothetical protein
MSLTAELFFVSPGMTRTRTGNEDYWRCRDLENRLSRFGYDVEYISGLVETGNMYGVTLTDKKDIKVDTSLSWNMRLSVLAHEAGHVLEPVGLTMPQGEAFAEGVALLVARDGVREHARYLAHNKVESTLVLLSYWPEIYKAASALE